MTDDPDAAVDFIIKKSAEFSIAEANLTYMTEYRKTIKALLMKEAEVAGFKTAALQEREAYANPKYQEHLLALQEAVRARENINWLLIAAKARIEVWKAATFANARVDRAAV